MVATVARLIRSGNWDQGMWRRQKRKCRAPNGLNPFPCPTPDSPLSIEAPHKGVRRIVHELGVVADEGQLADVGRAVALFADDDFGDALVGRFLVVVLVAVDEH